MSESTQWLCDHTGVLRSHRDGDGFGDAWTDASVIQRDSIDGPYRVTYSMMSPPPIYNQGKLLGSLHRICDHVNLLRVHKNPISTPDSYTWTQLVERRPDNPDCAWLSVAFRSPTPEEYRAVVQALLLAGFRQRCHERHYGKLVKIILKTLKVK